MEKKEAAGGITLSSLNAVKASEAPFEFEYITPDGSPSGVFLLILGGQSEVVTKTAAKMINEHRKKKAAREMNAKFGSRHGVDFDTLESDVEFGQRLAAVRLVGWRGISDPYTPENALLLCQTNKLIAAQIMEHSENLSNFMRL
jgi:hypothetical protein